MNVCVTLKSEEIHSHQIDGTFLECQGVVYATYGRLNIDRIQFRLGNDRWIDSPYGVRQLVERTNKQKLLTQRLINMGIHLYRDHFHLINTLAAAVDACGCRLGTFRIVPDDSGRRVLSVFGLDRDCCIIFEWTTTEYGNLEANFRLFS